MPEPKILGPKTVAFVLILLLCTSSGLFFVPGLHRDVPLKAQALQAGYSGSINITVRNDVGKPIVGATVGILGNSSTVQTDANGHANITGVYGEVAGTTYGVYAQLTGYPSANNDTVLVFSEATTKVNLTLEGRKIYGIVESSAGGPASGATVWLNFLLMKFSVNASEADGVFTLAGLPGGFTLLVNASAQGYVNASKYVYVPIDADANGGKLLLTPNTGSISGFVRSGSNLLNKVNISLQDTSLFNVSAPDGSFQILNITAGTYNLTATKSGYVTAYFIIIVAPGGHSDLRLNMTALPGLVIKGTVKDENEEPLVNVKVSIVSSDTQQKTEFTNIDGVFEFTGLTAGNYTLQFEMGGYRPMLVSHIVVSEETPVNMTFTMSPIRHGFSGFIFGFDMAHSMMILALFLTIVILALAVYLRIRTFQAPENAPAVYDNEEETGAEGEADEKASSEAQEKKD